MKKNITKLLTLIVLLMAATGAWAQTVTYPKYLVIDIVHGNHRYTDTDPDLTDDKCRTEELWLRFVPAGTFTMGSQTDEPGYVPSENLHDVTLTQPYYIGMFECTQYQWAAVIDSPDETLVYPSWFRNREDDEDMDWETRPVERVSYLMIRGENSGIEWPDNDGVDENSFMGILRERTGMKFDLPTEAQWEYACRAGKSEALNSGEDLDYAEIDGQ